MCIPIYVYNWYVCTRSFAQSVLFVYCTQDYMIIWAGRHVNMSCRHKISQPKQNKNMHINFFRSLFILYQISNFFFRQKMKQNITHSFMATNFCTITLNERKKACWPHLTKMMVMKSLSGSEKIKFTSPTAFFLRTKKTTMKNLIYWIVDIEDVGCWIERIWLKWMGKCRNVH